MFSWKEIGRKSIRLPGYDYSTPGLYYITICTQNREHWFGHVAKSPANVGADPCIGPPPTARVELSEIGLMVETYWNKLPRKFPNIILDEFVIMPNHIHGIVEMRENVHEGGPIHGSAPTPGPTTASTTVPRVVQWFKQMTTNAFIRHHRENHTFFDRRLWQVDYYERIVRGNEDLERIREYIRNNPQKWKIDQMNTARV